jgi:hypothetical protein
MNDYSDLILTTNYDGHISLVNLKGEILVSYYGHPKVSKSL